MSRPRRSGQQRRPGAQAVAKARGPSNNRQVVAGVVGVIVLAAVVIGGVLWVNAAKNTTEGDLIPAKKGDAVAPVSRDGAVVISGHPDAKVTIDLYEDFLCPACAQFNERYGQRIEELVASGKLRVRYHMLPMLVNASDPPGYSLDAANAALCAADQGKFLPFYRSLFAAQPPEGARGYDKGQLIRLGRDLGITAERFAACVNSGTHNQALTKALEEISKNADFRGTPSVFVNGKLVDLGNENWLDDLLAAKA